VITIIGGEKIEAPQRRGKNLKREQLITLVKRTPNDGGIFSGKIRRAGDFWTRSIGRGGRSSEDHCGRRVQAGVSGNLSELNSKATIRNFSKKGAWHYT